MMPSVWSTLADSGLVGTWETDLATQTVEMNGALPGLLGLDTRRAAAGVPVARFIEGLHPEDRDRVARLVREAHRTAGRFEAEFQTYDGQGGVHWVAARGAVEVDQQGRGFRCLGVAVDLTDAHRNGLMTADQRLRSLDRVTDALIAIRPMMEGLASPVLRTLIDATLFELGKLMVSQMPRQSARLH